MLNEKTIDLGSIIAIARSEARNREKTKENPSILALRFLAELNLYVAVYQVADLQHEIGISKVK